MNHSLQNGQSRRQTMQRQKSHSTPSRQSDQDVIPPREQNRNTNVDETWSTRSIFHIFAEFELRGCEEGIRRERAKGNERENYGQDNVDADGDAKCSAWQVTDIDR